MKRSLLRGTVMGLTMTAAASGLLAQTPTLPTAAQTDPVALGWMVGSPPPADKLIRFADGSGYKFPQTRWSFSNFRQLLPTTQVSRGTGAPVPLPRALRDDLDAVSFVPLGKDTPMTWAQAFDANYTDGVVVLHKGRIVYERYAGALRPEGQHISMSVTKSFFGTLGAMLVAEGKLDENAPVSRYVPELKDSAFGDATIRQVLDMRTGLKYSENYLDPNAEIWQHTRAGGVLPRPPGYQGPQTFYEFLQTVKKEGEHGGSFAYKTVNSDALGWVIRRATGQSIGQLLSERIWSRLGMEQDAYFTVDSVGNEFAGGGLNAGLRDMARFGEMMRNQGKFNGQQIIPAAVVQDIAKGGDKSAFPQATFPTLPGWSYRNMWWVSNNEHGAYSARGIHGQAIYIDPKAEMVIVRFASHPMPNNPFNDPNSLPAYMALAKHLMK
ncbi:serine hydrolase [Limnohabitans sp. Jir72]|uniref:serine hydrolase domain-containing protein n=1 Tax=Limnohabitans sp. Jir72 TaxID=1977909 RepID=UPI000D3D2C1B|nr:serine hydrolase [Limnohabitans sp. Jir72]PUE35814.1 6-aminohexanoate hydrolase [Limnohabitans sp. Jir72]